METINERFAELLKYKGISVKEVSKLFSKSEAYIRKLLRPGESFGIDPVYSILNSIPDVSIEWLLNGTGPMLKTNTLKSDREDEAGNMDAHVGSELNYRLYYSMESIIDSIKNGDKDEAKQNVRLDDLLAVFAKDTSPELQRLFVRILISTSDKLSLIRTLKKRVAELEQQVAQLEARLKQQ